MTELSKTQREILEAASAAPATCVRTFMKHIKNLAIVDKVITSMRDKGLIEETTPAYGDVPVFVITEKGANAIAKSLNLTKAAKVAELTPAKLISKKQLVLDMLKSGTTIKQLMEATSWQRHTVFGTLANLKKKLNLDIKSVKQGDERTYKLT